MFWYSFPSLGKAAKSNDNTTSTESWKHFVKSFRITNSQITNKFSCNIKFISHYNLYLEILMVGNTRVCIYRYISGRNPPPLKYHCIFINNSINSCLLVYNILMFSMYLSYKKISFISKIFCKFSGESGQESFFGQTFWWEEGKKVFWANFLVRGGQESCLGKLSGERGGRKFFGLTAGWRESRECGALGGGDAHCLGILCLQ